MNKRVVLIAAGACLLIAIGWYLVLWSPAKSAGSKAHTRAATAEQQRDDLQGKVTSLEAAKQKLPAIQAQLDALRKAVPDTPQLDQAIATVDAAATGAGVSLQSLS